MVKRDGLVTPNSPRNRLIFKPPARSSSGLKALSGGRSCDFRRKPWHWRDRTLMNSLVPRRWAAHDSAVSAAGPSASRFGAVNMTSRYLGATRHELLTFLAGSLTDDCSVRATHRPRAAATGGCGQDRHHQSAGGPGQRSLLCEGPGPESGGDDRRPGHGRRGCHRGHRSRWRHLHGLGTAGASEGPRDSTGPCDCECQPLSWERAGRRRPTGGPGRERGLEGTDSRQGWDGSGDRGSDQREPAVEAEGRQRGRHAPRLLAAARRGGRRGRAHRPAGRRAATGSPGRAAAGGGLQLRLPSDHECAEQGNTADFSASPPR